MRLDISKSKHTVWNLIIQIMYQHFYHKSIQSYLFVQKLLLIYLQSTREHSLLSHYFLANKLLKIPVICGMIVLVFTTMNH